MKVAMICQPWDPVHPPVSSGSVAIWVYEVCRRLAKSCDVTVFAQHAPGDLETEHHEGVEYRRFPLGRTGRVPRLKHRLLGDPSPRRPFFASQFYCTDFISAVTREIRERKFDVVHIQNYSQFVTTVRRHNPDVRIILHMRCEWLLQLDRRMLVKRVGQADLVVSVGRYLTNATIQRFPEVATHFMTLANGVDVTYFDSLGEGIDVECYQPTPALKEIASRAPADVSTVGATNADVMQACVPVAAAVDEVGHTDAAAHAQHDAHLQVRQPLAQDHANESGRSPDPLVLFVSRISPEKGVHVLLDAFARVHQEFPRAKLRLIGPPGALEPELMLDMSDDPHIQGCAEYFRGDYLALLKARISPQVGDAVEFLGHVPHHQLPEQYRQATMVVLPSLSEAFGRPVIEAMACGVPVIGARTGGIAETITHMENGLLVPPNDPEALAEAMIKLISDPELCVAMGVHGWRRVQEMYSWESIAARTRAYYEELLSTGSRVANSAVPGAGGSER
jgi:glycosyltransferase involved in cell wall biosynthesis